MTTITLPSEIETPIAEEARRLGTTTELLAIESLRKLFQTGTKNRSGNEQTLFDCLAGHIGTIDGTTEALSEDCGRRFSAGMKEKHRRGKL